jgi:hypothetical protein
MTDQTEALRKRILADVAALSSPTRVEVRRNGAAIVLFAIACIAGVALMRGIPDLGSRTWPCSRRRWCWCRSWRWPAGSLYCAGDLPLLSSRSRLSLLLAGAIGPLAIGAGYLFGALAPSRQAQAHAGFIADSVCAAVLLCAGLVVLVALIRHEGRSEPVSPGARGVAVGGVVAAAVGAALAFQCPESSSLHYGLGHLLPAIAVVVMGGLLGRSWLAPRWADPKRPTG